MELGLDSRHQEMLAVAEPIAAKYLQFPDGHFWLGAAHENLARDVMRTDPKLAATRLETAATHIRRAYDLGGGDYLEATIRGLIDLYEYALPRPDVWKATILDAVRRYPAEPVVHWYAIQLLLREGRAKDLPAALSSARTALPRTPPRARLEFGGLLAGLAEREASAADVRPALVAEAEAYADETLKAFPTGANSRRAQALKDDVARLRQTKGGY